MQNIDYFQKIDKCLVFKSCKDIIHLIADADFNIKSLKFSPTMEKKLFTKIFQITITMLVIKDGFYIVK